MLSAWAEKRIGTLNKFYTRTAVGDVLISELGDLQPSSVIDLGAGEGSLSAAVSRRWPKAQVTTVDVDPACVAPLNARLARDGACIHRHIVANAMSDDLADQLGRKHFDLAVCNPPFYRPEWQPEFASILAGARLSAACPSTADATAEVLFLAQNLRLVAKGGTIAIIVPDGIATGRRFMPFREALLEQHQLRTVVQLPPHSFIDTEAHCFILVIQKKAPGCDHAVKLVRLVEGGTSGPIWIGREAAVNRLDWEYHSAIRGGCGDTFTLRELGADVRRGSLSSVQSRAAGYPVFHTGDFPPRGDLVNLAAIGRDLRASKLVIAEAGDILMARVDRDLHQKVTMVAGGATVITDCIYRVRLPANLRESAFKALSSDAGRARIRAVSKGVGARLLGKGELLALPLSLSG